MKCRVWPFLTIVSSLPCLLFLVLIALVFIPPTPTALAASTGSLETADPSEEEGGELTTYQSIEEIDEVALKDTQVSHSESLLVDLLKTQTLLLEATEDVAKATKVSF